MSFPILKAKDGNEFYNKFLDSITSFGNMYVAPDIFGKNAVLVPNNTKRPLTKKEIETFVKIYLLPKLNLFYSKIDYTFTQNADNYYKYYYNSLNKFDNLSRFYLNLENPAVKRINFEIHQKMILDQKKSNSNKSFYDEIIKNNEEVVVILKSLSGFLDILIKKNKTINKKYDSIVKLIDELKDLYNDLFGNTIVVNINNKPNDANFQERINNMIEKLDQKPIEGAFTEAIYTEKYNKIKDYKKKYEDFLKKYQTIMSILISLDINITGFELNKAIDFNDVKLKLKTIYVKSYNTSIIYDDFLKNISSNIKKIDEINKLIESLKSMGNKKTDFNKTLAKIKFNDVIFLNKIVLKDRLKKLNTGDSYETTTFNKNLNYKNPIFNDHIIIENPFFKLLFYVLGYVRNNMIMKHNYLLKPATTVDLIDITGNNTDIIMLRKAIDGMQNFIKDNEENIDEKIKNIEEEKTDLQKDELTKYVEDRYKSEIEDIEKKKNPELETERSRITGENKTLTKEINELVKKQAEYKTKNPLASDNPFDGDIQEKTEIQQANTNRIREISGEITVNKKQIKHYKLLNFKEITNIELINKKIKLQEELKNRYDELKSSNPFKDYKVDEFIGFDESLKKFKKDITKESSKTSKKNPIVSYFTENYLYFLYSKHTTSTSSTKNTDKLKELFQLFYNKSKPLIRTNKNKEEKPNFNENFIEKINNYINNTKFKEFIENADNEFKSTITKLLKKYKNENKFKCIDEKINIVDNITNLNAIINKCITSELNYEKNNKSITKKIFPYTNFIIAYFAIYLIIINTILDKINKDSTENINKIILESSMMELN